MLAATIASATMDHPTLVWVAVAAVVVVGVAPSDIMEWHSGSALPPDLVVATRAVPTACMCKKLCYEDTECRGCTSSPDSSGRHTCYLATSALNSTDLNPALQPGSITYIKRPYCTSPYVAVEGVGCMYISRDLVTYEGALTGCPEGFQLFQPRTNTQHWVLAQYLLHNYAQPRSDGKCGPAYPLPDGAPAACDRDPNKGLMCCLTDGSCASPSACSCSGCINYKDITKGFWTALRLIDSTWKYPNGRVLPSEKGSSIWGPNDPEKDEKCAAMFYAPNVNTWYHLASLMCDKSYTFVCQKIL